MKRIKVFLFTFLTVNMLISQSVEINGLVIANSDVEGIHVINKSSKRATTTNVNGLFVIQAKHMDTLVFSSIQYKLESIIVSNEIIEAQSIVVNLIEQVNELDEVTIGKILTGDLLSDIKNSDVERPINFYDVGIPGYTGKRLTQSERRLYEAEGEGTNYKVLIKQALTGGVQLFPIINAISGRTKMLKQHVKLEAEEELMYNIKAKLSDDFFSVYEMDEELHMDFFFFCSEDENFANRCKGKIDIVVLEYLKEKYLQYNNNVSEKDD